MIVLPCFLIIAVCLGAWARERLLRSHFSRYDVWNGSPRNFPYIGLLSGLYLVMQHWMDFHSGYLSEGSRLRHVLYGRTFAARTLCNDYIYTIEPQNIHTITHDVDNFKKSEWVSEAAKHIGNGILLNEGEAWELSKNALQPMFANGSVDEPTLMEPHVRRLVAQMMALSEKEESLEFQGLADKFMLDVVTEFLFGKSTSCLESPRTSDGEDGLKFLALVRSFDGPSASFIALGAPARVKLFFSKAQLKEMVVGMKAFFARKLADIMANAEATSTRTPPWSVFQMMRVRNIPDEEIQGELQNIFFASWDTTSTLLANTLYALLRNQHVQARLREEIRYLEGKPPTKQDLNRMQYLRLVVEEGVCTLPPQNSSSHNDLVQARVTYHVFILPTQLSDIAPCSSPSLLAGHIALAQGESRHHPSARRRPRRPKPHCRPSGDDPRVVHVLDES